MPKRVFDRVVIPRLERILRESGCTVACSTNDPDLVYGFRIGDDPVHFVFVKSIYRRMGFAKRLCPDAGTYTLSTPSLRRLASAGKLEGWTYDWLGYWETA
jgi:hypothetical protein